MFVTLLLLLTGFAAGFTNGFLGTVGGIILVFALRALNKNKAVKDVFATALTVTLALSAISVVVYFQKNNLPAKDSLKFLLPALAGGFFGAYLLEKINVKWLKYAFGALMVIAGINMTGVLK